jgi:hypothetical protein
MWWINVVIGAVICLTLVFVFRWIYYDVKRNYVTKNFIDYRATLEYNMERAFDLIYKDRILVYSLDALKVDEEDIDKISKEYVQLVQKLIGPSLQKEFLFLYGNVETFTFNLLEYFNLRYENDEIRKDSMENLMTDDDLEDK